MLVERDVVIGFEEGLHARPAALVAQLAKSFRSAVDVVKEGRAASAKSSVKLMLLAVKEGERVSIRADGEDADAAVTELALLMSGTAAPARRGPSGASGPADVPGRAPPDASPPGCVDAGLRRVDGIAASDGVVLGPVFVHLDRLVDPPVRAVAPENREAELLRFREAASRVGAVLEAAAARAQDANGAGSTEAQVFAAVHELAADPSLIEGVEASILAGQDAASAILAVGGGLADTLARIDDPYFRLRAEDVRGVSRQIARVLLGLAETDLAALDRPSILVAGELTAVDLAKLPTRFLTGLITTEGGASSHVAIIARSLGIPAVVGAVGALAAFEGARRAALDGTRGFAVIDPPDDVALGFDRRSREAAAERLALRRFVAVEPRRADGVAIEVAANIGSPDEVEAALENGAMGVGLFRTEFLFMRGATLPSEDEQFRVYSRVAAAFAGRPVIVRTLDIGGDKPLPGLASEPEANPFLGWRGIRMCLGRPELFRPQLRALLRAAAVGRLRIMFPMICDVSEVRAARVTLDACRRELEGEGVPTGHLELGIMIETPAAALCAAELAPEVDFFSIGTNDLTQYTMAADRTNPRLASLSRVEHPAVMRLIELTCEAARAAGIWVGICGEAAADPALIPRFLGWGVTELSMGASFIPRAKQAIVSSVSGGPA